MRRFMTRLSQLGRNGRRNKRGKQTEVCLFFNVRGGAHFLVKAQDFEEAIKLTGQIAAWRREYKEGCPHNAEGFNSRENLHQCSPVFALIFVFAMPRQMPGQDKKSPYPQPALPAVS